MKALLVPADLRQRAMLLNVRPEHLRETIKHYVGGTPERTQYDRDAEMWVHESGAIIGLPVNYHGSNHAQTSEAGRRYQQRTGQQSDAAIFGNVVMVGVDGQDVPNRLIAKYALGAQYDDNNAGEKQLIDNLTDADIESHFNNPLVAIPRAIRITEFEHMIEGVKQAEKDSKNGQGYSY